MKADLGKMPHVFECFVEVVNFKIIFINQLIPLDVGEFQRHESDPKTNSLKFYSKVCLFNILTLLGPHSSN